MMFLITMIRYIIISITRPNTIKTTTITINSNSPITIKIIMKIKFMKMMMKIIQMKKMKKNVKMMAKKLNKMKIKNKTIRKLLKIKNTSKKMFSPKMKINMMMKIWKMMIKKMLMKL